MTIFSVIIPVYKIKEEYLRQCLNSLVSQVAIDWEAIIVDDGSPDNCGGICDEYAAKDNRIKVIHKENEGVSVARNVGIKASESQWIAFIDPDDWVEPDWASTIINSVEQFGSNNDIFFFDYYQNYAKKQFEKTLGINAGPLPAKYVKALKMAPFDQFYINNKVYTYETNVLWIKVYRASLFKEKNIYFDPEARKGQDVILNAEMLQITDRFYYIRKSLYHYRYIQESITNRFNPKVSYYNEIAFKHYDRIINKYSLGMEFRKAFYARVLTRLYSSMRLYYFHEDNKISFKDICRAIDEKLSESPYNDALRNIDEQSLKGVYRVFVHFLKSKNYRILWCLVKMRHMIFMIKGAKLG